MNYKISKYKIPQGSVYAPTLYIAYTHDIPQPIDNFIHIFSYANDVTLLTTGRPTTPHPTCTTISLHHKSLRRYMENKTNPHKNHFMIVVARDTIIQNEKLFHLTHTLTR